MYLLRAVTLEMPHGGVQGTTLLAVQYGLWHFTVSGNLGQYFLFWLNCVCFLPALLGEICIYPKSGQVIDSGLLCLPELGGGSIVPKESYL